MEKNLQGLLEKLSHEVGNVRSLSNNLQNARATSVRNSIRLMDSQVNRNKEVHDGHLREVETRHREEISSKVEDFEKRITEIRKLLGQKDEEVDMLRERLHECRKAKNLALEDNMKMKDRYNQRINDLEEALTECKHKLLALENEKAEYEQELAKAEELQEELEASNEICQRLQDQLKRVEEDIKAKEEAIEKLEGDQGKLEAALQEVQHQNEELSRQLSDLLTKPNLQNQDEDFKKVLEERLNAVQKECEEVKAILKKEESSYRNLSKKFSELEYEHKLKKVDLRIAEREKKELSTKMESYEKQTEELTTLKKVNLELNVKLTELEESVKKLTEHLGEREKSIQDLRKIVDGQKEQNSSMELNNMLLKKELEIAEVKLREVEHLQQVISHKDEVVAEKNKEVEEKEIIILTQKGQIRTLKELAVSMEQQLIGFTKDLDGKLAPLEETEKIKNLLESENVALREKLNKCRVELNEAKSLKTFTEKRLQQTESSLKVQSQTKESQVADMMEKLSLATRKNEENFHELEALTRQVNDLEKENFELRKKVEVVTSERDKAFNQYNSCCKLVMDSKQEALMLHDGFKKVIEDAERYKELYLNEQKELGKLKHEKKMDDVRNGTKIDQQSKLIEHLVAQLDTQDKKKHSRLLFLPKKVVPATPGTPSLMPVQTRRTEAMEKLRTQPSACPMPATALEQEQLALNYLEQKRDNLRNQLENMHNVRNVATPVRKTPTLPAPARKPENIFKERANTISGATAQTITGKKHTFLDTKCEKDTWCVGCQDTIKIGRSVAQCIKCLDVYHVGCSPRAGGTCLSS